MGAGREDLNEVDANIGELRDTKEGEDNGVFEVEEKTWMEGRSGMFIGVLVEEVWGGERSGKTDCSKTTLRAI
jgi:hypothetical protein